MNGDGAKHKGMIGAAQRAAFVCFTQFPIRPGGDCCISYLNDGLIDACPVMFAVKPAGINNGFV